MTVVLIKHKITPNDIKKASEEYGQYIKVVVDIDSKLITIGGQWHADGERILLDNNCHQDNIWGGGIKLTNKNIDTNALINIRARLGNNSPEILNLKIREEFIKIVKDKFSL